MTVPQPGLILTPSEFMVISASDSIGADLVNYFNGLDAFMILI